jgi:hypothetical protein
MAYKQYTQCVQPDNYSSSPGFNAIFAGLFASLLAIVGVMLATGGLAGFAGGFAAMLGVAIALMSLVHWWLYGRLICLGGEKCAIGMVVSVEPKEKKSGLRSIDMDTDYCFNLLLAPHLIGAGQSTIEADGIMGELIKEQAATKSYGLSFAGYTSKEFDNDPDTAVLHCECEGAGVYIFYQYLKALVALSAVGTVLSALCLIPVIGWIACAIAAAIFIPALLAYLAALIAGLIHANSDTAYPSDVNPELGDKLVTNGPDRLGADLLLVKGEWVYDSLHSGWNEIHPVRYCQKIGSWGGIWEFDASLAQKNWCEAVATASSPLTQANQLKPENQWEIHPIIDGCMPRSQLKLAC